MSGLAAALVPVVISEIPALISYAQANLPGMFAGAGAELSAITATGAVSVAAETVVANTIAQVAADEAANPT
jgi:hypothetical protein